MSAPAYAEGGALVDEAIGAVAMWTTPCHTALSRGTMGTLFVSRTTRYGHDLRIESSATRARYRSATFARRRCVCWIVGGAPRYATYHPGTPGEAFVTELQALWTASSITPNRLSPAKTAVRQCGGCRGHTIDRTGKPAEV